MEELEELAIKVRDVIFNEFPEDADYYIGELLHSAEYVFSVAEEICKNYKED